MKYLAVLFIAMIAMIGITDYIEINTRPIRNKFNKESRKKSRV